MIDAHDSHVSTVHNQFLYERFAEKRDRGLKRMRFCDRLIALRDRVVERFRPTVEQVSQARRTLRIETKVEVVA